MTTVQTPAGVIVGRGDGLVRRFLGIPYAQAPVGERRFAVPTRRGRFAEPFEAFRHGATAQRVPLYPTTTIPEPSVPGEDVLNLNIFTPDAPEPGPLPVLVWIHGGAFLAGSQASPWYDGRAFVRDGIVCVTVGYRLGLEGFPHLDGVPTNLGLRDLLLALDWVQENIASFGGDPGRVTIAGQSAGGAAVLALLASPLGAGRFQRAASLSGLFAEPGDARGRDFMRRLARRLDVPPTRDGFAGCSVEGIQREILAIRDEGDGRSPRFGPFVGDDVLPVSVAEGLATQGHDIPLLLGSTGDEFDSGPGHAGSREEGTRVTDTIFRSTCMQAALRRREAGAGTWLYSFEWPSPIAGGSAHCIDLPFFFDLLDASGVTEALGPQPPAELATLMHADLVEFIQGQEPKWGRATGGLGDPAREFGRVGAALAADTTGVYDPVVPKPTVS